jgi:hypothetical protein
MAYRMNELLPVLERLAGAAERIAHAGERLAGALELLARSGDLAALAATAARLADHLTPTPAGVVGTPYIAKHLGCTTVWVAEMARRGDIPQSCLVQGTGNGKPWKFNRYGIDAWLKSR